MTGLPAAWRTGAAMIGAVLLLAACSNSSSDPIDRQRGQWLFINYWAEWCKPCIREVPELNALHARDGYAVLGVNYDGAVGEVLQAQIDKLGIAFPTLDSDPAVRFGVERPQVLPTTLIIDPRGQLRQVLIGPQTEERLLATVSTAGTSSTEG